MTRIGVDIGGTFTDVVAVDDDGHLHGIKTPSTPDQPDDGVIDGLDRIREGGVAVEQASFLGHGTTIATNAVLEDDLAKTALVTTDGFRDVTEIGRQDRPDLYDLNFERTGAVVPRDRRFTVPERIGPDGDVIEPLEAEAVADVAAAIPEDVEAIAISTLFSFRNDDHERRIRSHLETAGFGDAEIVLSSDVLPEFREYERTTTTTMNAALKPTMDAYLGRLSDRTREIGIEEDWVVMQSHGGLMSEQTAREQPVQTLLSGPAAGVKGAQYLATAAGHEDVLTMDMGGTSTDVSLVDGGEPSMTTDWEISGHPLRIPSIDIHTIGAGGGSIAWIDAGGALRVGPESAGADPGPAAYGRGGTRPTVTDAHVVLGRIHPDHPLGEGLSVVPDAAEAAIEREIADPLDRSVRESARGILEVARANMERALRVVSVEQGYDPRSFALVAFGGAGPLHAPRLAEALSIPTVLIPRAAGVLSGLGLLASDLRHASVTSVVEPLAELDVEDVTPLFDALVEEGDEMLAAEGIDESSRRFERSLDLRYEGQSYSLNVDLDGDLSPRTLEAAARRFHEEHEAQYGHANPAEPIELVNVRVTAVGRIPSIDVSADAAGTVEDAVLRTRPVEFGLETRDATVYDHAQLPPDGTFDGPAVVQADESTTVVHPGQSVRVDERGTLIITTRDP